MKKICALVLPLIAVLLALAACTKEQPEQLPSPQEQQEDVTLPEDGATPDDKNQTDREQHILPSEQDGQDQPPEEQPKFFSELSGLGIAEEYVNLRPIGVMINNNVKSLPQSGIENADIIFDCEAEGGETRMLALFKLYADLGVIGTVRSARDYFIDFAQIFDAIYVHGGGSPQAYQHIKERKIQNLDGVNMYLPNCFWRDAERRKTSSLEHTLVTSGEKIAEEVKNKGYRTQLKEDYVPSLVFAKEQYVPEGQNALYLKIPRAFPSEFQYDAQTGCYTHTQHGLVQSDKETGNQLKFKNVLVLFASQRLLGDEKNRISVDFTGKGEGYYLTMGKYIPITWQRDGRDSGITLATENGDGLVLNPGKSFISVVNTYYASKLTFS